MKLADLKWPDIAALPKEIPAVFPIAAHEQHGRHLPLHTDSILLSEIVRRVEHQLTDSILFTPLQWFGNSHHHLDFPGTLSAEPRLYLDLLLSKLECLFAHGFRRLILLNGHGGNIIPGAQSVFELRQKHRQRSDLLLLSTTYWENANPAEHRKDFVQTTMGHACEWETSMMLALRPELVGDYQSAPPVPQTNPFPTAVRGWTIKEQTTPGHIGSPAAASREKGKTLLHCFAEGVAGFLQNTSKQTV